MAYAIGHSSSPTQTHPCCAGASNAGIYDAQAFTIGNGKRVHQPRYYPDARKVVARCGQVGYACEADTRLAQWADAYPDCKGCAKWPSE